RYGEWSSRRTTGTPSAMTSPLPPGRSGRRSALVRSRKSAIRGSAGSVTSVTSCTRAGYRPQAERPPRFTIRSPHHKPTPRPGSRSGHGTTGSTRITPYRGVRADDNSGDDGSPGRDRGGPAAPDVGTAAAQPHHEAALRRRG